MVQIYRSMDSFRSQSVRMGHEEHTDLHKRDNLPNVTLGERQQDVARSVITPDLMNRGTGAQCSWFRGSWAPIAIWPESKGRGRRGKRGH